VTTCFGLYHQAIIRSQVNNRFVRKLDIVIHKIGSHSLKMQRDLIFVILYGSIYTSIKFYTGYRYLYQYKILYWL